MNVGDLMENNKAFILMLITCAVFLVWIWVFRPNLSPPKKINQTITTDNLNNDDTLSKEKIVIKSDYELINIPQEMEYDLEFENDNIIVEFDPHDAIIKHAWIKDTFLDKTNSAKYDLVIPKLKEDDPLNAKFVDDGALRLKFGSWKNELTLAKLTGGNNLYHYERVGNKFSFTAKFKPVGEDTIYTIEKIFTFIDDEYIFKLDINFYNDKGVAIEFDNSDNAYSIGLGPLLGVDSVNKSSGKRQEYLFTYFNGKSIEKIKPLSKNKNIYKGGTKYGEIPRTGDASWVSNNGHYFAALIYPDNKKYQYFFDARDSESHRYYSGLARNSNKSRLNSTFYCYIGPKKNSILDDYDNFKRGEFLLEETQISKINEKIFLGIGNVIGSLLELIYKGVKNYGIAIIILTLIIKIVLFPLTHKSMVSQQRMSKLQPKIKEIQEKYKDKPEMVNKETMKLYKKEGINPLGGCLPILLQMPILFAMYRLLNRMVELKGATFLWIKDLSLPDAIYTFSGPIPVLNITSLNILPIIMVAMQIVSSLMMPDTQSNKQAKIMMWSMPIFFFFIFYNVASGLVLYWTIMNVLNMVQQLYLNRQKTKAAK